MKGKALLFALLILCSCNGKGPDDSFLDNPGQYTLVVKGRTAFRYDQNSCQTSYNTKRHEYGVHTDNMSDWFRVTLDNSPHSHNQKVKGDISWTESRSVEDRKGLTFSVSKVAPDGRVWLWCRKEELGAIIQTEN